MGKEKAVGNAWRFLHCVKTGENAEQRRESNHRNCKSNAYFSGHELNITRWRVCGKGGGMYIKRIDRRY